MEQQWKKGIRSITAVILSILLLLPNYTPWLSAADEAEATHSTSEAIVMQDVEEAQDDTSEPEELPFKIEYDFENGEWHSIKENRFKVQEGKRFRVFVKFAKESSDELKNSKVGFKIEGREADARWYEGEHVFVSRTQGKEWFNLGLTLQAKKAGEETITVTVPGYDPIDIRVEIEEKKNSGPNPWDMFDDEELPFEIKYRFGKGSFETYDPEESIELQQKGNVRIEVLFDPEYEEEEEVIFEIDSQIVDKNNSFDGDLISANINKSNLNQINVKAKDRNGKATITVTVGDHDPIDIKIVIGDPEDDSDGRQEFDFFLLTEDGEQPIKDKLLLYAPHQKTYKIKAVPKKPYDFKEKDRWIWGWEIEGEAQVEIQSGVVRVEQDQMKTKEIFEFKLNPKRHQDHGYISLFVQSWAGINKDFKGIFNYEIRNETAPDQEIAIEYLEGGKWFAAPKRFDLTYDLGEKTHTLKATAKTPVEWKVVDPSQKVIDLKQAGNELKFQVLKAGEVSLVAKAGEHQKEITISVKPAEVPRIKYRLEGENDWKEVKDNHIRLTQNGKGILLKIDNGESGWKYELNTEDFITIGKSDAGLSIQPKKAGTSVLTAIAPSRAAVQLKIEVTEDPVTGIKITPQIQQMAVGEKITLSAVLSPEGSEAKVEWNVDKEELATIDDGGVLHALKEGTVKVTATVGKVSDSITVEIVKEALPRVYFLDKKTKQKKYLAADQSITLTVLDEGEFFLDGEGVEATHWHAREKYYLTDTEYAIHFWIDKFSRYHPRQVGEKDAVVTYKKNGSLKTLDFTIKVVPSHIEEIKAFIGSRELSMTDPIEVQGSERTHFIVKGRLQGQSEFHVLPETAYTVRSQENQHIIGSSFALWKPETFVINTYMRDDQAVQTNFKARSVYVPVTGFMGEVPKTWYIDEWNNLSGQFNGIRWYDTLEKGYTLRVAPDNASYWELKWEALTPEIATYDPLFSNGIVPKKPGVAKFRVSSVDNPQVTKEVQVEFVYKTPLVSVSADKNYEVEAGKIRDLVLDISPANASEQRFVWTYDQEGIVKVTDAVHKDPTNTNIPKWTTHAIRGLKPGTVRVTGTPIDRTNGAKPIEFTVAVTDSGQGNSVPDLKELIDWSIRKMNDITGEFGARASKDRWMISELGKLKQQITPQEIEAIYNKTIIDGKVTTSIGELSKSILALRAAGIDPERYHGHNLVAKLSTMDPSANVYEITPYLWALSSDRYHTPNVSHAIDATLGRLLSMRNAEGLWTDAYGGWTDATGFALYALAPYHDRKEVKDAVEMAVDAISEKQYPDGDVDDNSNSLAMVAGGLWSNDRSYLTDARLVKSGKTMLHALKGYELTSGGFVWKKGEKNSNLMATEQAFRALIAYNDGYVFDYRGTDKKALGNNDQAISVDALIAQIKKAEEILKDPARYDQKQIEALRKLVQEANDLIASPNVDRSSIDKKTKELSDALAALKPSGQGGGNGGSGGGGSSSSDITVSFTLEGMKRNSDEKQTWVNKKSYTMPKNSTVESLFKKVLDGNGIKYVDTGNYIKSIRSPFDNEMLSEFTNGQNSGWMYKVNEVRPNVGFSHYKLNNNDDVVWFYTNDYTKEPGHDAGNSGGGAPGASGTPAAPGTPAVIGDDTTPKAQAPSDGAKVLFEDVPKDKWYAKAVQAMVNKGLAKGRSNDRFEPEAKITRAEFIAILARIDGKSIEGGSVAKFKDVKASDWYYTSIAWASKNRIAAGDGDNFHPNRPITREEMATMLSSYMRYNTAIKLQNKAEIKAFADQDKISGWAKGSVQAMQAAGIIGGRSNDLFEPKAHATRAETMEMLYRLIGE